MKFETIYNDYGPGYIVKMEDGRYAMVNVEQNTWFTGSEGELMQFGQWRDADKELPLDTTSAIEKVLTEGEEI